MGYTEAGLRVALAFAGVASLNAAVNAPIASDAATRARGLAFASSLGAPALRAPLGGLCSARPAARAPLVLRMGRSGANLVTFGDVWRDACDDKDPIQAKELGLSEEWESESTEESEEAELRPLEAVSNVLTGLIERITKDPEEDEVRKNMEAFAKMHGGAVAPPMSEEEKGRQVSYAGMFPDIVDALIEEDLEAEEQLEATLERELRARVATLEATNETVVAL
jgi:hypothetical protein